MQVERIYIDRRVKGDNFILQKVMSKLRGRTIEERACDNSIGEPDFHERQRIAKRAIVLAYRTSSFIKRFHAPPEMVCPGFLELNYGLNCSFNCHYCYLRLSNRTVPMVTQYVNFDKLISEIRKIDGKAEEPFLLNSGELQDSLHIDHLTAFSKKLIPFFAGLKYGRLLLLTKSDKVNNLLSLNHDGKTIVSFTINCSPVIRKLEEATASLARRLKAAERAAKAGYEIRFRFDPIFPITDWPDHYSKMAEAALSRVKPSVITLGTYRPHPALHCRIIKAFPGDGFDKLNVRKNGKKMYYPEDERVEIYSHIISLINEFSPGSKVGLCKETKTVWKRVSLQPAKISCNCLI